MEYKARRYRCWTCRSDQGCLEGERQGQGGPLGRALRGHDPADDRRFRDEHSGARRGAQDGQPEAEPEASGHRHREEEQGRVLVNFTTKQSILDEIWSAT